MPDPIAPPSPVPAEGPTGPIQTLNASESKPSAAPVEKPSERPSAPATPTRPEPRVVSSKELKERGRVNIAEKLLGRTPKEEPAKGPARAPDGKFASADGKPKALVVKKAEPVVAPPIVEAAPVVAKIKIGEQEMTAEEVSAHVAKLEKAAADAQKPPQQAPEPPKAPEPAPVTKSAQELAAEETAKENDFLAKFETTHGVSQIDFDRILADGDVKAFNQILGRVAMDMRKFASEQINPALDEIRTGMAPVLSRESEIAQFQQEHNFLAAPENKDIADAKDEGRKALREAASALHEHYDLLQAVISTGRATEKQIAMAKALETPEQWNADLAYHARALLKSRHPAPVVAPVTPAVIPPPKPRPEPPGGQPTGAGGSAAPVSSQRSVIDRISSRR